ncbi:MAG: SGNH/GDSL hydrolase family protein [Limosilactobacillus reuteri]|nr:SGNH/GDSL hydrolase family protein [Limosilactobacillus reuteri]MDY2689475.1 SGNH/GDSL hydrolase family protein [Limosilactobacillus reuteri]
MQSTIIQIDTLKPMGTLVDLTNQFNARVGDAFTPITIQWTEGKIAKNLDGLHPVFEAAVGQGHLENGQIQMSADAVPVRWVGDQSAVQNYGQTVLKFPPQVFPKEGLCYGHLALENDQGVRETSVDIWFKVFGGVFNMGLACNYFITDFVKALAKAKGDVYQALDDIKQQYQLKIQAAENAIDDNIASLKKLASAVGAIQAQIDAGNVVTLVQHNRDIKSISNMITEKLAQMSMIPEAFENLDSLKQTYPNGKTGIMVTIDTGHKWIWFNNAWNDCGIYQVAGDTSYNNDKFIANNDDLRPPYDDLNSLPINSTVTYVAGLEIQNIPSVIGNSNFTIHTYGTKQGGQIGSTQLLFTDSQDNNSCYYRTAWGSPAVWSEWQISKDTKIFTEKKGIVAPYNSLDTLPAGSIVSYEPGLLDNDLPYTAASQGYTVITSGSGFAGKVQDVILSNGTRYHRISWGSPATWSEWQATSSSYVFVSKDDIKKPFDNLDTLPGNSTVTYVTGLLAADFPFADDSQGYTITTNGNGFAGKVQTVTCTNKNRYYRLQWGSPAKWGDWQPVNSNHIFVSRDQLTAPYDNLDLLPSGSLVTYVSGLPNKELPFEQDPNGYTIMTNGNGFTDTPDSEIKAGQVQIVVSANGSLYHRIAWGSPAKWGDWQDDSYTSKMKYDNLPSLAIFNSFAVIGDSYSKGYIQKADSTILGETNNKWGQFMASQYGTTFTDLSVSGQNTRKFVEGYLDRLKQTKAETYFIVLGINDASPDNNIELGSLDDIKNDSSTNPQTFYGDYARIIDTIKQTSPNSKIVLFTIMADWGLRNKFDPAIKNIGKYYSLPVINVLDDQYFSSPLFSTLQSGGHPTVPGYGILANHLMQLIQKCVIDNPDYFNFMGC